MPPKHTIRKELPQERQSSYPNRKKISFGFSELRDISFPKAKNDQAFFIQFIQRLKKYSQLDWNTLYQTQRHGFGTEYIEIKTMTKAAQELVSMDMERLIALRATGDNHVFLGYRDGDVFQVVFIEYNFGDIYSHS